MANETKNKLQLFASNAITKFKKLGRRRAEPKKDSVTYPLLMGSGKTYANRKQLRPNVYNLRYFSRTPYVRKAINALKNPIKLNKWEIRPIDGVELNSEIQRQIDIVTACFNHPNHDDNFATLMDLTVEDWAVFGAGCIEHQLGADPMRPIWMWPVDAQSIYVYPGWSGGMHEARYLQMLGFNNIALSTDNGIKLRNSELIYIRANPCNDTPYGFGPVQVAFDSISRILGAGAYAGNLASNAQPENLLWFQGLSRNELGALRAWWRNTIEGQGETPIFGSDKEPKSIKLHGGNDDALYLKWQEFLSREIAIAFDLSPQNLGIERDVNRNTAEVGEDRDWAQAIRPLCQTIQSHLTREVIHENLGFYHIEFVFVGLEREDELITSQIYKNYYESNALTPNEQRAKLGQEPLDSYWGDKVKSDIDIAIAAARGTKIVDDPTLKHAEVQKGASGSGGD